VLLIALNCTKPIDADDDHAIGAAPYACHHRHTGRCLLEPVEKTTCLAILKGMDGRQPYPSDLTDREWSQVSRFIPTPKPGGRPAKYERREIVNALLYVTRTGGQWRALPHDFPPWDAVYWYFRTWKKDGTLDRLHDELRGDLRRAEGH
jgi:transposase